MEQMVKLVAFDLDGTLTQHKSPLEAPSLGALNQLGERYQLLMVGAGACMRIYNQMEQYPIDIVGNYGMQFAAYNRQSCTLEQQEKHIVPVDTQLVTQRADHLRQLLGYTDYAGETIEIHACGMLTFPILGTKAALGGKLAYDPYRIKRRAVYSHVVEAFPEYKVFVGGSSSFDIVPKPFNKLYALDRYCAPRGITRREVVYVGDDYGLGGNDEDVFLSDIRFICVEDYTTVAEQVATLLK